MKPGEAKVGQRVRTLAPYADYPDVKVGTLATIVNIVAQDPGAETDDVLIQPDIWSKNLAMPTRSKDLELCPGE